MRKSLFALPLFLLAIPVAAQIMTVRPVAAPRPVPQPVASQSGAGQLDITMDPERARAEITRLRTKNRELRQAFGNTLADLQSLRVRFDEMTRPGGSLVTASCVSRTLSRNTAGMSEDCAASGYTCADVSGLCHRTCNTSDMCSSGFACNMDNHRCELPPVAEE